MLFFNTEEAEGFTVKKADGEILPWAVEVIWGWQHVLIQFKARALTVQHLLKPLERLHSDESHMTEKMTHVTAWICINHCTSHRIFALG